MASWYFNYYQTIRYDAFVRHIRKEKAVKSVASTQHAAYIDKNGDFTCIYIIHLQIYIISCSLSWGGNYNVKRCVHRMRTNDGTGLGWM